MASNEGMFIRSTLRMSSWRSAVSARSRCSWPRLRKRNQPASAVPPNRIATDANHAQWSAMNPRT